MTDSRDSIDKQTAIRGMRDDDAMAVSLLTTQLGYSRNAEEIAAWIARLGREDAEQTAFVACVGEEVVGWIEVSVERRLQSAPFGMIGGLVVSEVVRGRGIGGLLCRRAEEWTREQWLGHGARHFPQHAGGCASLLSARWIPRGKDVAGI